MLTVRDRIGQVIQPGDFIVYATKTEAPSLQFAFIEEIDLNPTNQREIRIKIHRATWERDRLNKIASDYFPENPDGQKFVRRDTGKPDCTWLRCYTNTGDAHDHRLLVIN